MSSQPESNTRLQDPWRTVARLAWITLAIVSLGLFIVGTLDSVRETPPECAQPEAICNPMYASAEDLELAQEIGLGADILLVFEFAYSFVLNLTYIVVGALIFWRKSDDWMALLLSITLLILGAVAFSPANDVLVRTRPDWQLIVILTQTLAYMSILFLVHIFPDGRFAVPRVRPWVIISMVLFFLISPNTNLFPNPVAFLLLFVGYLGLAIYALIYRYRRVSNALQRQQIKWVSFGLTGVLSMMVVWGFANTNLPAGDPSVARIWFLLVGGPLVTVIGSLFPVCVAISMLRYRLWDIDIVINRTLVYGALTGLLGAIYFGSAVLMQQVFRALTGQESPLTTVVSTLVIAALFTPLRRRIQNVIDRRFYRRKYDAEKTLAAFSATVRDEVELEQLSDNLLAVIEETMQPAHLSLWLRKSEVKRKTWDKDVSGVSK